MASIDKIPPVGQEDSPDVPVTRKRFVPLGMLVHLLWTALSFSRV
jgi:hypothetical protein